MSIVTNGVAAVIAINAANSLQNNNLRESINFLGIPLKLIFLLIFLGVMIYFIIITIKKTRGLK